MKLHFLDPLMSLVPRLISVYSLFLGHTTRLTTIGPPGLQTRRQVFGSWPQGVIYALWHSRFFYFSYYARCQDVMPMISASKDGEIITRAIKHMRLQAVRGSSSKRGQEALQEAAAYLRQKHKVFMLPDGPRGPRHQVKPGTIRLAQMTGCPILPAGFSTTSGIFLPSWDYFLVPLPFGKAVLLFGDPIYIKPDLSEEEFVSEQQRVSSIMQHLCHEADRLCGRDPAAESQKFSWLHKKKRKNKDGTTNSEQKT